jgi:hypothetical protein
MAHAWKSVRYNGWPQVEKISAIVRRMSTEMVVQSAGSRTTLRFSFSNFDSVLTGWAMENGYRLLGESNGRTVYQKGTGLLVAPMMLEVAKTGDDVELTAWVRMGFFVRLMSFFILPAEMGIQSGGLRAAVPRSMARKAVNKLLVACNQTPLP